MKKNKLFVLIFVFVMFFGFNLDVKADTTKECFYKGQVTFNNGNQTGTNYNQTVAVGIKYSCNDKGKCSSEYAASYIDKNNKSNSLNFTNSREYFGPNKGSDYYSDGQIRCPSNVVVTKTSDKFYFYYKCKSGESANGNCLGNGVKLGKTEVSSGNSLAEKAKNITDDGSYYAPSGDTTPATEPEKDDDKEDGDNEEQIDDIINAADRWNYNQTVTSEDGNVQCIELLGDNNIELIRNALLIMAIIGIILVIAFGISDFVKAIASSDDDALKQAGKHIKNRIISVVILLLLPVLVDFVLGFVNDNLYYQKVDQNGELKEEIHIKVGKVSDCGK